MTMDKSSKSKHNGFSLVKKIGITFIIPIFLAVLGGLLVLSVGWNYISASINLSKLIQTKPVVQLAKYKFKIDDQEISIPNVGEVFAKISIPAVSLKCDVYQGDDEEELSRGVGHNIYSTIPGQGGKVVLCAHRDGYFAPLKDVKVGDQVTIDTKYGTYYYQIDNIWIAKPTDMTVTEPTNKERLTMYTCYPFNYIGSAPQRYIVEAKFLKVDKAS